MEGVSVGFVLDAALALALPVVAWRATSERELRKGIVLFVAFGLLSALAWARLAAADIALVEAAVGAGLTGTLLMSCVGFLGVSEAPPSGPELRPARARRIARVARAALVLGLLAALVLSSARALSVLARPSVGLSPQVAAALEHSGVEHPVTAVLLNFRGLDTLLEVFVLLVAAIGVQSLGVPGARAVRDREPRPLLDALTHLLAPGFVLVAGYLVWQGSHGAGGAFQAAAVLAGGGVLLLLAQRVSVPALEARRARAAMLLGPALFLLMASAPVVLARAVLEYPEAWAGTLIVALESVLTISIALMLVLFVPLGPGLQGERGEP